MYDTEALEQQLARAGYKRVECATAWRDVVKARYAGLISDDGPAWADARCPMAVRLLDRLRPEGLQAAPIEPILLCCARELSLRRELDDGVKFITTPCRALADAGNALGLPRTRFETWREFARRERIDLCPHALRACPVPPGFF